MTEKEGLYRQAVRTLRHDARNLQNAVEVIQRHLETAEDGKGARFIGLLRERIDSMTAVGERVETLAEMPAAVPVRCDLQSIVHAAVEGQAGDRARVGIDVPSAEIIADPTLSELALSEVVRNALQTEAPVVISLAEDVGRTAVRVRDEGPGIGEPARAHLFLPLKGARRPSGTSLGLPIAAAAMQAQGGDLRLESTGPEGTSFLLVWPRG
jgi:signal transduction histidine kinase